MARAVNKLSARRVQTLSEPGMYGDGGGLYLKLSTDADGFRKRWLYVFRFNGRRREMGLGSPRDVSLAEAREAATQAGRLVRSGVDPIAARNQAPEIVPTFGTFADTLIDDIAGGFRNEKHIEQWRMTLGDAYCATIRKKPVDKVTTEDVLAILRPIWTAKNETASRIRGRIERVLDAAKAKGHRSGENPARWRGHLDALLPKRQKLQRGHHAAMPYEDVPAFMARLKHSDAMAARALEFTILTAARSGETRGATWDEIDLDAALWSIPGSRMKAGKPHRVPLVGRALEIVRDLHELRGDNGFMFPGQKKGMPLSVTAMEMLLRRLKVDATVHGFRSSFRDWAGNETAAPREVAEAVLAHRVGDATEQAYRRGDALEKRRSLVELWHRYVSK